MQVAQRNLEIAYHDTGYYDRRVAQLQEQLAARRPTTATPAGSWDAPMRFSRARGGGGRVRAAARAPPQGRGRESFSSGSRRRTAGVPTPRPNGSGARSSSSPSPPSCTLLGRIYYNRGLNDEALVALERAVELNPDNANAHYLMAFVLGDLGRHQERASRRSAPSS